MFDALLHVSGRLYAQEPVRRWKFIARSLLYGRSQQAWLRYLSERPWMRRLVVLRPELLERLHRPYQCRAFNRWGRLEALRAHYETCEQIGWLPLCERAARGRMVLARIDALFEQPARLELHYDTRFGKEGEWALSLTQGSRRCYTMVLGFRQHGLGRSLHIGCLQGPDGSGGREQVRALTRAMHGLRPRDLLLEAARELASCSECTHLELVSDAQHIYRSLRKRRRFAFAYDEFAREHGATPAATRCWSISLRRARLPLEQVHARKRAATARRRALLDDLREQIRQACAVPAAAQ